MRTCWWVIVFLAASPLSAQLSPNVRTMLQEIDANDPIDGDLLKNAGVRKLLLRKVVLRQSYGVLGLLRNRSKQGQIRLVIAMRRDPLFLNRQPWRIAKLCDEARYVACLCAADQRVFSEAYRYPGKRWDMDADPRFKLQSSIAPAASCGRAHEDPLGAQVRSLSHALSASERSLLRNLVSSDPFDNDDDRRDRAEWIFSFFSRIDHDHLKWVLVNTSHDSVRKIVRSKIRALHRGGRFLPAAYIDFMVRCGDPNEALAVLRDPNTNPATLARGYRISQRWVTPVLDLVRNRLPANDAAILKIRYGSAAPLSVNARLIVAACAAAERGKR